MDLSFPLPEAESPPRLGVGLLSLVAPDCLGWSGGWEPPRAGWWARMVPTTPVKRRLLMGSS